MSVTFENCGQKPLGTGVCSQQAAALQEACKNADNPGCFKALKDMLCYPFVDTSKAVDTYRDGQDLSGKPIIQPTSMPSAQEPPVEEPIKTDEPPKEARASKNPNERGVIV